MNKYLQQADRYGVKNYKPLDVVLVKGEGVWVYDDAGKKYMDMLAAYSAVSQGHCHPRIVQAMKAQLDEITITSRAFNNDKMGEMLEKICTLAGYEKALPMNTGAEAVETALKTARKWGEKIKGVAKDQGEIIVCENNFHGRTITIISFSSEEQYKDGFGPLTPGFRIVKYNDAKAIEAAMNENTVAVLIEPIQGEGGVLIPDEGYLTEVKALCKKNNVLFMLDEIQTGLGRTGKMFAYEYERDAKPDVLILGKALGGGVYPVSMVLASSEIMSVYQPGDHGSTFGGNPLGAAAGIAALDVLVDEKMCENSFAMGAYLADKIRSLNCEKIKEIRAKGLMIGVEIKKEYGDARKYCEMLMERGILCKETHATTIRFTPPLVITKEEIDWAFAQIKAVLMS